MNYLSSFTSSKRLAATAWLLLSLTACGGDGTGGGMSSGTGSGGGLGYGGGSSAPTIDSLKFSDGAPAVGTSTTLTWSTTGATSCKASGAWSGSEPAMGSLQVAPTAAGSYTYTLSCTGPGGTATKSATLTLAAPSSGPYALTTLVANGAGSSALTEDANLSTPWGIVFAPNDAVWVSNFASQTSTLYDGDGKKQPVSAPLVVKLPPGASGLHEFGPHHVGNG